MDNPDEKYQYSELPKIHEYNGKLYISWGWSEALDGLLFFYGTGDNRNTKFVGFKTVPKVNRNMDISVVLDGSTLQHSVEDCGEFNNLIFTLDGNCDWKLLTITITDPRDNTKTITRKYATLVDIQSIDVSANYITQGYVDYSLQPSTVGTNIMGPVTDNIGISVVPVTGGVISSDRPFWLKFGNLLG